MSRKKEEDLPPWAEIQKKTFTNWVNVHLVTRSMKVENLATDLSDGLKLINLLEEISLKRMPKYNKNIKFHNQKLENVGTALKFLKDEGLKLVAIGPEDVVECRIKLILGLIWTIILRWQIQKIQFQGEGAPPQEKGDSTKAELLNWVNSIVKKPVRNFTKDFQDGAALQDIANHLKPKAVTPTAEEKATPLALIKKVVETAEKDLKVPAVISPEDIISPHLDDLSMMTYVAMYRDRDAALNKPDVTKFTAHGPGLTRPVARKKNKFTVVSRNAENERIRRGGLPVKSKFSPADKSATHDAKVRDVKDGTYAVGYVPTSPGEYLVYVTLHDAEIAGSPFAVTVSEPTHVDTNHSSVETEAKEYVKPEEAAAVEVKQLYFRVTTRDSNGAQVPKGGAAIVCAIFPEGEGEEVETIVNDNNDGTYDIVFTEPAAGEYSVAVGIPDDSGESVLQHVRDSPFNFTLTPDGDIFVIKKAPESKVEVAPEEIAVAAAPIPAEEKPLKEVDNSQTTVDVHPTRQEGGRGKRYFRVVTKDKDGEPTHVPNTKIHARIAPSDNKGPFFIISRLNNLVLSLPESKNKPGTYTLTWNRRNGNPDQLWRFTADGFVESIASNLVLDIQNDGKSGSKVIVWDKKHEGTDNQRWHYNQTTEQVSSQKQGLVLDVSQAKKSPGANIIVFSKRHPSNNRHQRWYLVPHNKFSEPAPPTQGSFYILSRLNDLALAVENDSLESGSATVLWERRGADKGTREASHQLWKFTQDGFVQNVATGLVLDIKGDGEQGTQVIVYQKKPKDNLNQKWKYDPVSETLESDKHGLVVDVSGGDKSKGAHVIVWERKEEAGNKNQRWYLVPFKNSNQSVVPNSSVALPYEVEDHKDGTYHVVFTPEAYGKYDVSVGAPDEEGVQVAHHFHNSPFVADIVAEEDVDLTLSSISHDPVVTPQGKRVFKATLKDKDGHPVTHGGIPLVAYATGKDPHSGKDLELPVAITDNGDGTFDVVVAPITSGPVHIDAGFPDSEGNLKEHLHGAPFTTHINLADDVDPSQCSVDKHPLTRDSDVDSVSPSDAEAAASRRRPHKAQPHKQGGAPVAAHGGEHAHPHKEHEHGAPVAAEGHEHPHKGHEHDAPVAEGGHEHEHPHKEHGHEHGAPVAEGEHAHPHKGHEHEHGAPVAEGEHAHPHPHKDHEGAAAVPSERDAGEGKHKPKNARAPRQRVFKARTRGKDGKPLEHGGVPIVAKAIDEATGEKLPVKVEDNGDGTYDVVVDVPSSGPVKIEVGLPDTSATPHGEEIKDHFSGSPFVADINLDDPNSIPDAVLIVDPQPHYTRSDPHRAYFTVRAVDKNGHPVRRPVHIAAKVIALEDVPENLEDLLRRLGDHDDKAALAEALAHTPALPVSVKDNGDGTYKILLEGERRSGDFILDVGTADPEHRRAGQHDKPIVDHAPDAPLVVPVDLADADVLDELDMQKSEADLSQIAENILDDGAIFFPIQTRNKEGEPMTSGGAPIGAVVTSGEHATPAIVIDNGDGTYDVVVVPDRLPGVYEVAVALENEDGKLSTKQEDELKNSPIGLFLGEVSLDGASPLESAAAALAIDPESFGFSEEDSEEYGFDVIRNPDAPADAPKPEDVGAHLEAVIEGGEPVTATKGHIKDKGHERKRITFKPKHGGPSLVGVGLVDDKGNAADVAGSPFVLEFPEEGEAFFHIRPRPSPLSDVSPVTGKDNRRDHSGKHKKPVHVKELTAPSAEHTTVDGPGVNKPTSDLPTEFFVHAKDHEGKPVPASPAAFEAHVTDPNGNKTPIRLVPSKGHALAGSYTPTHAGAHVVDVAVLDKKHNAAPKSVKDAPFRVEVVGGFDPSQSVLTGPGVSDKEAFVSAAEAHHFKIEARGKDGHPLKTGGAKFEVSVSGPGLIGAVEGLFVHPEVTDNGDGTYSVSYKPHRGGKHTISAKSKGKDISNSPVEVTVEDVPSAEHTTAEGEGLLKPTTDVPTEFVIHTKDHEGNPVTVRPSFVEAFLVDPEGNKHPIHLTPGKEHSLVAAYTPKHAGPHSVEVAVKPHGSNESHPVKGAPFHVAVEAGVDPTQSVITGAGVSDKETVVVSSEPHHLKIEARGRDGHPVKTGGAKVEVSVAGPVDIEGFPKVTDNDDGTYSVSYKPNRGGKHIITVRLDGKDVSNSPAEVTIEDVPSAEHTTVEGEGVHSPTADAPNEFVVHTKDNEGNAITVPREFIVAFVTDPHGNKTPIHIAVGKEHTLVGTYFPTHSGPHIVEVAVKSHGPHHEGVESVIFPVKGAPFHVEVHAAGDPAHTVLTGPGVSDKEHPLTSHEPAVFKIEVRDKDGDPVKRGGAKFDVSVSGPGLLGAVEGLLAPTHPEVTDHNDGTYTITYLPNKSGKHKITVKTGGKDISNSPAEIDVEDVPSAEHTTVEGDGLLHPTSDSPAEFVIHPKDHEGNPITTLPAFVEAFLVDPHGNKTPITLTPKNNTLVAAYTPTHHGPHHVEVAVVDKKRGTSAPVKGAPFAVDVRAGVDAAHSTVSGPGITDKEAVISTSEAVTFKIEARSKDGELIKTGGAKFEVSAKAPGLLANISSFFNNVEVTDHNDGTYTFSYHPQEGGKHTITVKANGHNITHSPAEIEVEEGTAEEESIAVDFMFTVEARTKSGQPRRRGGDKFEVKITGPGDVPVEDVRLEDLPEHPGKYRVFYTLPGEGKYKIEATLNGKNIKGSPWRQKV